MAALCIEIVLLSYRAQMSILTLSELNSIVWTLTSVSVVITALRLYARAFVVKSVGLDDYLISLGQVGKS